MATTFHERVRALLELAARHPTAERTRFVRAQCAEDAALQAEALELLSHFRRAQSADTPAISQRWMCPGATTIAEVNARALDIHGVAEAPTRPGGVTAVDATVAQRGMKQAGDKRLTAPQPPFCLDQYRVVEMLGCGGMGAVYRAEHATLHCSVALKLMLAAKAHGEMLRRFALEAEILRQLRHPNIAWFVHTGSAPLRHETAQGVQYAQTPYYVMEYVNGAPLHIFASLGALGLRARLRLLSQVAEAADFAHRRGVIHRDLKHDNILVNEQGEPKILDFGIARLEDAMWSIVQEERGRFIGTPRYASPEQIAGEAHQVTTKSDVFSLGIIAHELLTGRPPAMRGRRVELQLESLVLDETADRPAVTRRELQFHLRDVLSAALHHDPELRLASAAELAARLRNLEARCFRAPQRSWWARLLERFVNSRHVHSTGPHSAERPLRAVLQARIRLGVEARDVVQEEASTRKL